MAKLWNQYVRWVMQRTRHTGLEQDLNASESFGELSVPEIAAAARAMAADGIVLLKNENHLLPIKKEEKVAVFGRCAVDYFNVGYGSGGDVVTPYRASLMDGLRDNGVAFDAELADVYEKWCSNPHNVPDEGYWGHWPMSYPEMPIPAKQVASAAERTDLALVVIGRAAGESRENILKKGSFYLTNGEKRLLNLVTSIFSRVCVVMDCGNVIDMGWVKDYGNKISAVVYAWQGGMEGGNALADVLVGKVNPSAKLTDTIAVRYEDYPSASDFGDKVANAYTEDIYVGYRYFETFAKNKVLYPFGYGLSYTTFRMKAKASASGNTVCVTAEVENTGAVAGREVVQVYASLPQGKLGNPAKILVGFRKTKLLQPGESQKLEICVDLADFAPFDDSGVTGHRFCHVLETGTYSIEVGTSIRNTVKVLTLEKPETEVTEQLEEVLALYSDSAFNRMVNRDGKAEFEPVPLATESLRDRILDRLPEPFQKPETPVTFAQVMDGTCTPEDFVAQLTPEELDELTHGQGIMNSDYGVAGNAGAFGGVTESLRKRGLPAVITTDGPSGIRVRKTASLLPCGTALASSFDPEQVEALYALLGQEMKQLGSYMLLSPGLNIHRNPLCGRNFEYYSEDPLVSGKLAAAAVRGVQSTGRSACPKHFACNNQETQRNWNDSRVSQRALREIYLKGFRIVVKEADPWSIMTSYNKVNGEWSHYNYDLATTVLRKEWGYKGVVITDWWMQLSESPDFPGVKNDAYRIRAQVDVLMPGSVGKFGEPGERTLVPSMADPDGIILAEAQRSCVNVVRFVKLLAEQNPELLETV